MKIRSLSKEKYALIRLKIRETRIKGMIMKANETNEAIVEAYLLPT